MYLFVEKNSAFLYASMDSGSDTRENSPAREEEDEEFIPGDDEHEEEEEENF